LSVTRYVFNGDYSDLNTAITSAEANIGFENGEYAPYNNVASMGKLATAKALYASKDAINQDAIDAVTTNLIGATWSSANAGEVNAIYDGTFAAATNDGAPAGWRSTTHELGGATHARAFVLTSGMTNFDKLAAFGQGDTRSAFFIRFDGSYSNTGTWYNYGQTTGYEMPLKASTTYCLTLQAGAWGDYANKKLSVTIKGPSDYSQKAQLKTTKKTSNGEGVDDLTFFFTTTDAGNYTLSFWNENGANYAAIVSNIELKKAVAEDITIAENADYTPTLKYANVTFKRTLVEGWNGLVLPFDMSIDDVKSTFSATHVKDFDGITYSEGEGVTLNFANASGVKAGRPFLIKASAGTSYSIDGVIIPATALQEVEKADESSSNITYTMTGTYAASTDLTDVTFALINGTKFFYHTAGVNSSSAKAFRAYFVNNSTDPAAARVSFNFGDDETTGIMNLTPALSKGKGLYDLQGRRVEKTVKGLYIKDGRKVVVK
jgi:hypothetical protein